MAQFEKLTAPTQGTPIRFENGQPVVADNPIIPFIRGDGTGVDIWPATQKVLDAAVAKAYGGSKHIEWFKVYAGDEACDCLLYTSPSPRDQRGSRMPSSA